MVPPEHLLPALLSLVRTELPIQFRYLTHLTRLAIQHHLRPFMWLVHAFGEVVLSSRRETRGGGLLPARALQRYRDDIGFAEEATAQLHKLDMLLHVAACCCMASVTLTCHTPRLQ